MRLSLHEQARVRHRGHDGPIIESVLEQQTCAGEYLISSVPAVLFFSEAVFFPPILKVKSFRDYVKLYFPGSLGSAAKGKKKDESGDFFSDK